MRPTVRCRRLVVALGVLMVMSVVQPASGRDLDDRRDDVERQLDSQAEQLDQSNNRLSEAVTRLQSAEAEVDAARIELSAARGALAAAQALDRQMQTELDAAVQALRTARDELVRGRERMTEQERFVARAVVSSYQAGDPGLVALSMVLNSQDTAKLTSQLNSVNSVLDKASATLDRLEASRVVLDVQAKELAAAERDVARRRVAAAENLERTRLHQAQALDAQERVQDLVVARSRARDAAAEVRIRDLRELRALESERQRISELLEARAAAARQRAAEEAKAAAALARARSKEAARQRDSSKPAAPSPQPVAPPRPPAETFDLLDPVAGYVSSSYGMRFHPVYQRWSLHDGTDFAAACGTPVRAAASGTVLAVSYHSAYGNRVIMDNGFARGVGLGTAYTHLSAFSTYVNQQVRRGDVIGYVGTTGASTGCHLHFMVFANGRTVDPMGWL